MASIHSAAEAIRALKSASTPRRAKVNAWFFKSGPGEYAEGDRFLGVTVPASRQVLKRCAPFSQDELRSLMTSPWHEARLLALLLLEREFAQQLKREDFSKAGSWARFYVRNFSSVNNWDLVDASAAPILGRFALVAKDPSDRKWAKDLLKRWSRSSNLWQRRVAIVSTMAFIRDGATEPTWATAKVLLYDSHDLIHKATGWLLREAGKKDPRGLRRFLKTHAAVMPRTMLRYSIERLSPSERTFWLARRTADTKGRLK